MARPRKQVYRDPLLPYLRCLCHTCERCLDFDKWERGFAKFAKEPEPFSPYKCALAGGTAAIQKRTRRRYDDGQEPNAVVRGLYWHPSNI